MSEGYSKNELEEALVQALRPLYVEGGGYLRSLGLYRGELSGPGLMPEAIQLPAVFVSFASSTYGPGPYLHVYETVGFNVIVVCRAGSSPGAYKVLADIRDMLQGGTLGLDVMPLKLLRETSLITTKETTAFAAHYVVTQIVKLPAQA
jgi:phage gp37-like protein